MEGIDAAILVSMFLLALGIAGLVVETFTRTPAHRDALRRNRQPMARRVR
jgi:hypothetical protein